MTAAGIGTALLMIACCAGPALIAAGALARLGGILGDPWATAIAVLILAGAVTAAVRRRALCDACCPPTGSAKRSTDRDRTHTHPTRLPAPHDHARARRRTLLTLAFTAALAAGATACDSQTPPLVRPPPPVRGERHGADHDRRRHLWPRRAKR